MFNKQKLIRKTTKEIAAVQSLMRKTLNIKLHRTEMHTSCTFMGKYGETPLYHTQEDFEPLMSHSHHSSFMSVVLCTFFM